MHQEAIAITIVAREPRASVVVRPVTVSTGAAHGAGCPTTKGGPWEAVAAGLLGEGGAKAELATTLPSIKTVTTAPMRRPVCFFIRNSRRGNLGVQTEEERRFPLSLFGSKA